MSQSLLSGLAHLGMYLCHKVYSVDLSRVCTYVTKSAQWDIPTQYVYICNVQDVITDTHCLTQSVEAILPYTEPSLSLLSVPEP